jgi:hypothetical protein
MSNLVILNEVKDLYLSVYLILLRRGGSERQKLTSTHAEEYFQNFKHLNMNPLRKV